MNIDICSSWWLVLDGAYKQEMATKYTQLHTARYIILNILACNYLASELEVQLLSSSADLISWQRIMLIAKVIAIFKYS